MRSTVSHWRYDWRNVGRSCHTSYCIWIIYIEPGFSRDSGGKACDRHVDGVDSALNVDILRGRELRYLLMRREREVSTRVSSNLSDLKLTVCARIYLNKILAYMRFRRRRPSIDVQRMPIYICGILHKVSHVSRRLTQESYFKIIVDVHQISFTTDTN